MSGARNEIGSLTGLRGVAACWVVAYHLHPLSDPRGPAAVLLHHGYLAVDVLFVLSGFVMTLSYERLFRAASPSHAYAVFLLRRVARVYPLYLAATLIGVAFLATDRVRDGGALPIRRIAENLLLVQSWGLSWSIDVPAWSISAEFAAYLVFPLLLAMLTRRRAAVAAGGVAIGFACVALVAAQALPPGVTVRAGPLDVPWPHPPWPVLRCVAEFAIGMATFRLASRARHPLPLGAGLAATAAAALLLLVPGSDVAFAALAPLVLLSLLDGRNPVARALASPPVHRLGEWSYAIYLWHFALMVHVRGRIEAAVSPLPQPVAATLAELLFWAILFAVAAASFRWIEAPGRRFVRGIERGMFAAEDRMLRARRTV